MLFNRYFIFHIYLINHYNIAEHTWGFQTEGGEGAQIVKGERTMTDPQRNCHMWNKE